MAQYDDRERFIPFRKKEIVDLICADGKMTPEDVEKFRSFALILESLYHFEFHAKVEALKNSYFPFNPDKDTKSIREYTPEQLATHEQELVDKFREILNDANYEQITQEQLQFAMEQESLFKISLFVDFEDFDKQLIFWRGDSIKKFTIKKFPFKTVEIDVPVYERVAMLIRFKNEAYFASKKRKNLAFAPGSMVIKLFKNIPKADLEMLFPNTQVRMSLKDKLLMGIPAALGGGVILLNKGLAILLALPVIFVIIKLMIQGGEMQSIPADKMALLIGAGTALGAIAGYAWKQWDKYKNRKIQFMKTLADSLYFKNLDNNAGVFHHVVDAAEEEECKEAFLGYYFLLLAQGQGGLTEEALDDSIEEWFEKKHQTLIDFEVDDALRKLNELQLSKVVGQTEDGKPIYQVLTIDEACERIDYIWDNYFKFNEG